MAHSVESNTKLIGGPLLEIVSFEIFKMAASRHLGSGPTEISPFDPPSLKTLSHRPL